MIVTVTPNPVLDRTLTVPGLVLNEMSRATRVREDWGGKGFNVSRALLSLGMESVAMGFLGGSVGNKLKTGLEGLGIPMRAVAIGGETRTNVVITTEDGGQYIKVNESGPHVSPEEIETFFESVDNSVEFGDIWALCGSLPPGVPGDFYARLIEVLRAAGAKTLLDTSGEAFRQGLLARPDVIKPNEIEVAAILGHAVTSPVEAARAVDNLLNMGISMVALSLGADGLMLATGETSVWARPPTVQAMNPVGAGDALVAGMLWALERGMGLFDMARWGVGSGTAAAMREGVSTGTRQDVEALISQVQLAPMPGG